MFRRVLAKDDLWAGEMKGVLAGATPVVVLHIDGRWFAYEDRCRHQSVKLSEGKLEGCLLTCRAHGWSYDACTGQGVNPEDTRLARLEVRVEGDDILVDVGP